MSGYTFDTTSELKDTPLERIILLSAAFHILLFILIPLLSIIFQKKEVFIRPATFELVTAPRPIPAKATPTPKQIKKTPVPKKEPIKKEMPKEVKKSDLPAPPKKEAIEEPRVEEEIDEDLQADELKELEELFAASAPVSAISAGVPFEYQWYLNSITAKVERNWRPPFNDKEKSVTLQFTIYAGGNISDIVISKSSGSSAADNLAIRAIRLSAPFGKLPSGFPERSIDLDYTLRLTTK